MGAFQYRLPLQAVVEEGEIETLLELPAGSKYVSHIQGQTQKHKIFQVIFIMLLAKR